MHESNPAKRVEQLGDRDRWVHQRRRLLAGALYHGTWPELRATFDRLRRTGLSRLRIYRLLEAVHEGEVASMMREDCLYDHGSYVRALDALPVRPTITLDEIQSRKPVV